jgi:hypothetical protein
MTRTTTDALYRRLVENQKATTKARMAALQSIVRPSVAFLTRIAGNETNHAKLRLAATQRLEALLMMRMARKKKETDGQSNRAEAIRN